MVARRLLAAVLALVLAGCGGNGGSGPAPEPTPPPVQVVQVTTANPGTWAGNTGLSCDANPATGAQGFLVGPGTPPRGTGSYGLVVGSNPESWEFVDWPGLGGLTLDRVTALSFSTYVAHPGSDPTTLLAPMLAVRIDLDGDGVWDGGVNDDLVLFAPSANGTITVGSWQTWDALAGVLSRQEWDPGS